MTLWHASETGTGRERTLLFLAGFGFVLLVAVVGGLYAGWQHGQRKSEIERVVARLGTLADGRKEAVRSWLEERKADAQVLAWDPDLIEICIEGACPKGMDPQRLLSHLENHRLFSGVLGAFLFTPSGHALLAAAGGMDPGPESKSWARQAAREGRVLIHDIHHTEDGTPVIGFLAPVFHSADPEQRAADAAVLGVVGLYLDPRETLFPVLEGVFPYAWAAETYLVRSEKDSVRVLSPVRGLAETPALDLLPPRSGDTLERIAAVDGEGAGAYLDFRGTEVLASVRWISEAGWALVAKVDTRQALAGWRREARTESVLVASVFLCCLLGGVAAWRWWSGRRYRLLLEGLRDREERLRALAQGSEDVVFIKNTSGRYLLLNPAAAALLGTSQEDAVGRRTADYLDPAVTAVLEAHDRQVLDTGTAYHSEEVIPHRGQRRTFLSSRIPIRDSQGNLKGVAGVLRDITERKESEQELARWAQTLGALYRLARGLTARSGDAGVYDSLVDGARQALSADLAALYLADGAGQVLALAEGRNLPEEFEAQCGTLPAAGGLVEEASRQGEALAIDDCLNQGGAVARFAAVAGIASLVAVPLRSGGRSLGLLCLGFVAPRSFRPDEGEALAALGHMAGVAADRCRALESLAAEAEVRRRAEDRLRQLHASTAGLTGTALFQEVARAAAEELGARLVLVSRLAAGDRAEPCAAYRDGELAEYAPYALPGTPCQRVARSGELVHHADHLHEVYPDNSFVAEHRFEAYVGTPLCDTGGRVIGLVSIFHEAALSLGEARRDLLELYALRLAGEMERMLAEERLTEARRTLDTLIENLPGAVYRSCCQPDRQLEFISAGAEEVTGYSALQLLDGGGHPLGDLIVAEDRSRVWREIQRAVAVRRSFEIEYRIHDHSGGLRWVYDVGRAVWAGDDGKGVPATLEGVLFDHTERRSLEAQLTHSQRMDALGRLAGGVAHDFNNLLTAISGYTEMLVARVPDDPRARKAAGEVLRATDRAGELTRQLLAFGRRQVVDPKLVDLDELLGSVTRMLERLIGENIVFTQELGAEGGLLRVDPGQVEQVLLNLVVNGRDAMPAGGTLTVRTRCRDSDGPEAYVVLEVTDTGTGMEPEVLARVFDPFFTTKGQGENSGLGLAAVYGTVHQAGGRIEARSTPGEGTTFTVLWPRAEAHPVVEPAATPVDPATGGGQVVLLVEDEEAVRNVASEHLAGQGYRVSEHVSGIEAVAALDREPQIDVVVTDVVMPGMSGAELVRSVRHRWPGLPVVFISGHAGDMLGELDVGAPYTVFLQKPFRLSDLDRAVLSVLDQSS